MAAKKAYLNPNTSPKPQKRTFGKVFKATIQGQPVINTYCLPVASISHFQQTITSGIDSGSPRVNSLDVNTAVSARSILPVTTYLIWVYTWRHLFDRDMDLKIDRESNLEPLALQEESPMNSSLKIPDDLSSVDAESKKLKQALALLQNKQVSPKRTAE